MPHLRGDFGQRRENEAPLMHTRVRNMKPGGIAERPPVQQQIEVNAPRTPAAGALPAHPLLHLKKHPENLAGGVAAPNFHCGVHEIGLGDRPDRFGEIKG